MSQTAAPFITAETAAEGSLLVKAGGNWSIHKAVPDLAEVGKRLRDSAAVGSARLDFSQLDAWDSSLVGFVAELAKRCRQSRIPLQTSRTYSTNLAFRSCLPILSPIKPDPLSCQEKSGIARPQLLTHPRKNRGIRPRIRVRKVALPNNGWLVLQKHDPP